MLAVSLSGVVMNGDHTAVVTREEGLQYGLEGPSRLSGGSCNES
jgi:hypothetical protein